MYEPYSFQLEEQGELFRYIFTTTCHTRYVVYFYQSNNFYTFDLPPYLLINAYTFGLTKQEVGEQDQQEKVDYRIKRTIKDIVHDFYSYRLDAVLLIHYEDHDNKEDKRFRCFDRWYNDLNIDASFHKENTEIDLPGDKRLQISAMLKSQNLSFDIVLNEFYEVRNSLSDENGK